jgi:hypothetical protein
MGWCLVAMWLLMLHLPDSFMLLRTWGVLHLDLWCGHRVEVLRTSRGGVAVANSSLRKRCPVGKQ